MLMMYNALNQCCCLFILLIAVLAGSVRAVDSQCFGDTANGRIENAVKLPVNGVNFRTYSTLGHATGRTYVHSRVADIVTTAYKALERDTPSVIYVYGETGWASGGRIRPHRTHQNGLSVDFFVPVRNKANQSVPLPTGATNKFGYAIEFDSNGKFGDLTIDFFALAEHLYQLNVAAKARNTSISLVIFDPPYLSKLFATSRGSYLKANVPFMKGQAWVRHDEHYHVDFQIPCLPLR
jgi:penicillin-insensitive murein DD-endopeptidase